MIFKPVEAYPNNGVYIKQADSTEFTVTIQCTATEIEAYQLDIYNAVNFNPVYGSGLKLLESNPLTNGDILTISVPTNILNEGAYYWTVRLYQSYRGKPDMLITSGTINESVKNSYMVKIPPRTNIETMMYFKINGEYYQIDEYNIETEVTPTYGLLTLTEQISATKGDSFEVYTNFVTSTQFPFFIDKSISGKISLDDYFILNNRKWTFSIVDSENTFYTPTNIKWYEFILKDSDGQILEDTGKLYNGKFQYTFDGFISGNNYTLEAILCSLNDVLEVLKPVHFYTEYSAPDLNLPASAQVDYNNDAIRVSWVDDAYSEGKADGNYSFIDNVSIENKKDLKIESGTIIYDNISGYNLNTSEIFTLFTDVTFNQDKHGKIIELSSDYSDCYIYVEENNIYYYKDGEIILIGKVQSNEKNGETDDGIAEENIAYIWDDTDTWNDNKYWTESLDFQTRFKIVITADSATVQEV